MLGDETWAAHLRGTAALAAPIALAQLAQMAMALTDTLMLGSIGGAALAAGGLGANLFFTVLLSLQGVLSAVAVLTARARGAGREADIPGIYWTGLALALALAPPLFWLTGRPGWLLRAAGVDPSLSADIVAYLLVLRWGAPGGLIGLGLMRMFLPAIGRQRALMWVALVSVGINAALNQVLIHGVFGWPGWGAPGSAAATAVSLWIGGLALLALTHGRRLVALSQPRAAVLREMLAIGLPVSVTIVIETALFFATGLAAGAIGRAALTAHQIAISVGSITFMVPLAIGQAANVRVGERSAAGRAAAARRAGFAALALGAAFMAGTATLLLSVPGAIASLYLDEADPAMALTVSLLTIAAAFQVADGVQTVAFGALRGLKDTRVPMLVALAGYWGIGFWSGRWLAFDAGLGARGLWWGLFAGLAAVAVALVARFDTTTRMRPDDPVHAPER